jgi:hypothetical protein
VRAEAVVVDLVAQEPSEQAARGRPDERAVGAVAIVTSDGVARAGAGERADQGAVLRVTT